MFNTIFHCVKSISIRICSCLCFPEFGLNTKVYSVNIRIQSERGKKRTRKTSNTNTLYVVFDIST